MGRWARAVPQVPGAHLPAAERPQRAEPALPVAWAELQRAARLVAVLVLVEQAAALVGAQPRDPAVLRVALGAAPGRAISMPPPATGVSRRTARFARSSARTAEISIRSSAHRTA